MIQIKRIEGWRWWLGTVILAALVIIASGMMVEQAWAQADAPSATMPEGVTADQVNTVAREIWCPLCSGVRLDACELKACEQMKEVIALKLAEGEDTDSIKAYFVEQYGPQVLGEPPRQGFNWLAWILPAVMVVVGGLIFWRTARRMVQPPEPVTPAPTIIKLSPSDDEYAQKLEEELAKHG